MPKVIADADVFAAVIKVYGERGYQNATTKDIAAAAGIHEATLFRKYGTKADLFQKALAHDLSDTPLHRVRYTGDLEADLTAIVEAYLELSGGRQGTAVHSLLAQIPQHPELRPIAQTLQANILPIFQILMRYQQDGRLNPAPPQFITTALVGPLMVLRMFEKADPSLATADSLDVAEYVSSFLRGYQS